MAQVFTPAANLYARLAIVAGALGVVALSWGTWAFSRSSYATRQGEALVQPVPFSHKHHVDGLGLDCRYCHSTVETEATAGIPAVSVCMTCHSQVWTHASMLEPVRRAYQERQPIEWKRVNKLPDFVYFNHSIHVKKGVGCATCHGRVDQMPLTLKAANLHMQWCTGCHREPERYLRPPDQVFNMGYQRPPGYVPKVSLRPKVERLDCVTCHR